MIITLIIDRESEWEYGFNIHLDVKGELSINNQIPTRLEVTADVLNFTRGNIQINYSKGHVPASETKLVGILVDGVPLEPINQYIEYFPNDIEHPDAPKSIKGCDHFGYDGYMLIPFKQPVEEWEISAEFPNEKWIGKDYGIYARFMDQLTEK
tara:strand:- start:2793 stop:3251 length:459 start_codon:yes stop_codon:yes gene_type:complete